MSYFRKVRANLGCKKVSELVRAAESFVQGTTFSREDYQSLWSYGSPVFDWGQASRLRRLYDGRRNLARNGRRNRCAERISLLYFYHDLEERTASIDHESLDAGKGKATVAYKELARELDTPVQTLKYDRKGGANYTKLLNEAGPGSLLGLDERHSALYDSRCEKRSNIG